MISCNLSTRCKVTCHLILSSGFALFQNKNFVKYVLINIYNFVIF